MSAADQSVPASQLLIDTHVLIWSMQNGPRLGDSTRKQLNEAAHQNRIAVSAITPWEIALLVAKNRLQLDADVMLWVQRSLAKPGVTLIPLDPEIAVASTRLPFEMHPDPADRILVATARHIGATLVSADRLLLDLAAKGNIRALDAQL